MQNFQSPRVQKPRVQNVSNSHRVTPGVKEHDEILGLGVSVFDFALEAMPVHRKLGGIEQFVALLSAAGLGRDAIA